MVIVNLVKALWVWILNRLPFQQQKKFSIPVESLLAAVDASAVCAQYIRLLEEPDVDQEDLDNIVGFAQDMAELGIQFLNLAGKLEHQADIAIGLANAKSCLMAAAMATRALDANRHRLRLVRQAAS